MGATKAEAIHDVADPVRFVHAELHRTGLHLTDDQREELGQEGLAILCKMAQDFDGRGRFSGYAARYLRGKLIRAWHRMNEHHVERGVNGARQWEYLPESVSLQGLTKGGQGNGTSAGGTGQNGESGSDTDGYVAEESIGQLTYSDPDGALLGLRGHNGVEYHSTLMLASSAIVRNLRAALIPQVSQEADDTVQVALLRGLDLHRSEIADRLGLTEFEVRFALMRLDRLGIDLGQR